MCGDDIVFSSETKEEAETVKQRYSDVIQSLGGIIDLLKSVMSPLIEGVGVLYYCDSGGKLIDITSPTGSISPREAKFDTYLNLLISDRTAIGRAILYSWLSPAENHAYTYKDRREFWKWLLKSNYHLSEDSYRYLFKEYDHMPQNWSWDQESPLVLRKLVSRNLQPSLRFVSEDRLKDALITTKIKSLYKERKEPESGKTK
jgi:hypothetical protein